MSGRRLLLALLAVGVVALEVAVIVLVASYLGWWTLALMLVTSAVGGLLVKREWGRSWLALREALAAGASTRRELGDAAAVLAGGLLVLLPGFVTDVVGILTVLGPTRPLVRRVVRGVAGGRLDRLDAAMPAGFPPSGAYGPAETAPGGTVVRGEVVQGRVVEHREGESA
ncbi:MAG TPA: FxsA family protein [Streptosporangiales bacterium]